MSTPPGPLPLPTPPASGGAPTPTPPAPPPTPPTGPAGTPPGPAGGPEALRADLASERDRRQAAEAELATLRAAEAQRQAAAQQAQQAQESAETARVRQELQAAAAAAQTQAATATAHLIRSEARRVAQLEGVHEDRSETFLRLVDLTGVQLDPATGIPNAEAIRAAVQRGLTEAPEFRPATGGPRRAPAAPGAPGQGATPPPAPDLQGEVTSLLAQMQAHAGIQAAPPA